MGKSKPVRKVLIVTEYFLPHWTGVAQSIYYAARNLVDRGMKVTVLTTHFDHSTKWKENIDGIRVIRAPYQLRFSRTHYSFSILMQCIKMVSSFDTIILNSPNSNILFLALIAKIFRKRLLIYHQGDIVMPKTTGNRVKNRAMEFIFDLLTLPAMMLADKIGSFTEDYAKHSRVMKYFVSKNFTYIPDVQLSTNEPSSELKKKLDRIGESHVLIGIAGRFVEEKGFDRLFEAIPAIQQAIPNIHVVFAGKQVLDYEPYFEKNRELFESEMENVTFLGLLSGGDYAYFFESLDVFVLPSRSECFALTQIEALQKSIPIVVADTPGARMLVRESGFGTIVAYDDSSALAEGIVDVLNHPATYKQNRKKALEFIKKQANFPLF